MSNVNSRIRDYVNSLEADNQALRNELEALKADLDKALCKGYEVKDPDKAPNYHIKRITISELNKIKADAVLSIMGLDHDCETSNGDSAWSSNTIEEHANKLEQDND